MFQIIGAQHQHHQIQRLVAVQHRRQDQGTIAVRPFDRIIMQRGAATQTFLNQMPRVAQSQRRHAGPAGGAVEPGQAVPVGHRRRAVAVAVAIDQKGALHDGTC